MYFLILFPLKVMQASDEGPFVGEWGDATDHTEQTHGDCRTMTSAAVFMGNILGSHVTIKKLY